MQPLGEVHMEVVQAVRRLDDAVVDVDIAQHWQQRSLGGQSLSETQQGCSETS